MRQISTVRRVPYLQRFKHCSKKQVCATSTPPQFTCSGAKMSSRWRCAVSNGEDFVPIGLNVTNWKHISIQVHLFPMQLKKALSLRTIWKKHGLYRPVMQVAVAAAPTNKTKRPTGIVSTKTCPLSMHVRAQRSNTNCLTKLQQHIVRTIKREHPPIMNSVRIHFKWEVQALNRVVVVTCQAKMSNTN